MGKVYTLFRSSLCLLVLLGSFSVKAQSFSYTQSGPIPTQGSTLFTLPVSGLPLRADSTFGLISVTINVSHIRVGDLTVSIQAPSGRQVQLLRQVGDSGDNFVRTTFRMDAPGPALASHAPFTGTFIPTGNLANLNRDRQNPNGNWKLILWDNVAGIGGILNDYTLVFGANPPQQARPPAPCSFSQMGNCRCPDGSDTCDLLPDMTASARIIALEHRESAGTIRLSNATPNIGYGPLEVNGTGQCFCDGQPVACNTPCPNGEPVKEKILQRVYRKTGNTYSFYDRPAGYMTYHPTHGHVHVERWAQYTLRTRGPEPDPRTWPILATGQKVSFCLVNLSTCWYSNGYCVSDSGRVLDNATMPNADLGMVSGCGRNQGIYPGRADIYSMGLDGQDIDLTGICNGDYWIISITDPDSNMLDMTYANNVAATPIRLSQQADAPAPAVRTTMSGTTVAFSCNNLPRGARFLWEFGDGTVDSTHNPAIHTYAGPDNYPAILTVFYPCGSQTVDVAQVITGTRIQLAGSAFNLKAVPNPASGKVSVSLRQPVGGPVTIALLDATGREVLHQVHALPPGNHTEQLDLQGLAKGIYTVHLRTQSGQAAQRLGVE